MSRGLGRTLWLVWVAAAAALTSGILVWEVQYFKSPGRQFYNAILVLLPILVAGVGAYALLRKKFIWRFEPLIFGVLALSAMLFCEPRALIACVILFLAAYEIGAWAGDRLRLKLAGPSDRLLVRGGLGFGLLIPTLFLLGEFRFLYPSAVLAAVLIPIALRLRHPGPIKDVMALHERWKNSARLCHPMVGVSIVFGFLALVCTLMVALTPPITFDTLFMHLPFVEVYAAARSISLIPEIDYSYYPQGGETLWTAAYLLGGVAGVQVESVLFFVLFLMAVFRLARQAALDEAGAVVGTIWAGTLPFLHWTGSVVKNDMIMTLFQGLALYAFLRWVREKQFSWIVAGAFFLAQSFGVKHVALFGAVPLAVFYGYAVWKQQPRRFRAACAVAGVFILFGTFWTARTYMLTGNPVYPSQSTQAFEGATAHGHSSTGKVARYVKLPWTILFDGHGTFESPLRSPAGVILFAFVPLMLLAIPGWRSAPVLTLIVFALIYLAYWASILSTLRYALVPFSIAAVLAAQAAVRYYDAHPGNTIRLSIAALTTYCLMIAILGIMIIEINGPQIAYFAGRISKQGYLQTALRTFRSLEFLRSAANPNDEILGIDNCSRAYAPNPVRFQCMLCSPGHCEEKELADRLSNYHPRYLIVPEQAPLAVTKELNLHRWVRVHHDTFFSVYHYD